MYKRIFEIDPKRRDEMFAEKPFGVIVRPVKIGGPNEYVVEIATPHDRRNAELLVNKYAID